MPRSIYDSYALMTDNEHRDSLTVKSRREAEWDSTEGDQPQYRNPNYVAPVSMTEPGGDELPDAPFED